MNNFANSVLSFAICTIVFIVALSVVSDANADPTDQRYRCPKVCFEQELVAYPNYQLERESVRR